MKKEIINIAVVSLLFACTLAGASEFSGSYAGAKLGQNHAETTGSFVTSKEKSTTYGLEGGHGWDMGSLLLGVDGFYDKNRDATHTPLSQYGSKIYGAELKLGLPLEAVMPYAKVGYARTSGTGNLSNFSDREMTMGLGLEYKFASSWSVAAEWRKTSPQQNGFKFNNNNLTLGVNYYFSQPRSTMARTAEPARIVTAPPVRAATVVADPEPAVIQPAPKPEPKPAEAWKTILEEKPVHIEGANFDSNSAKLKPSAHRKLQEVVQFAKNNPMADMNVDGYTDNRGSKALNLALSRKRAESVKAYLVSKGVDAENINTKGNGMSNPIADNKTTAGRAKNRRVEIHYTVREQKKVRVSP